MTAWKKRPLVKIEHTELNSSNKLSLKASQYGYGWKVNQGVIYGQTITALCLVLTIIERHEGCKCFKFKSHQY